MTLRSLLPVMAAALLAISCTTTDPNHSDFSKSERVLGLDDDVRVEAIVFADPLQRNGVRIICDVENRRADPIVIYDVHSLAIYDPDTHTLTVNLGAEVPSRDAEAVAILSAESRRFEQTVSFDSIPPVLRRMTNFVKVRLHFLRESVQLAGPGEDLPSVVRWAEYKRTVDTNSVPVF